MTQIVGGLQRVLAAGLLFVSVAALTSAYATPWPERTVRILTGAAGSSGDAVARILAEALAKRWKQAVVVENRPSADHILTVQGMVEARDGHTLLFAPHSALTVNPLLHEKLPYDPVRDVAPISLAVDDFLCVVVAPSLPIDTLAGFVRHARTNPRALNFYAVPGAPYLAYLAFQKRAGIETTYVPYRNFMSALPDLSQGLVHVAVMPFAAVRGPVQAGSVKLLAVTNVQRAPAAPTVPTVGEAGFPEFTFGGLLGLFGPKDMPAELRERIASEVGDILAEPRVTELLMHLGLVARGTSAAEFAKILDEQRAKWAAIARDHDIRPTGQH
jgi:tripartite-type tricarboxylate transporter receptor subunit TctC